MIRYIVPIVVLLFACGEAHFSAGQEEENSSEDADVWAKSLVDRGNSSTAEDTGINAEGLPSGSADHAAANTMIKGEADPEIFNVGVVDRKLDILIVVDNSTTMNTANMQLSEKIAPLLSKISGSDWQIAITTSTITDCLRGILKKGESSLTEFKEIVSKVHAKYLSRRDYRNSHNEQVVKMATRALKGMPLANNAGQNLDINCSGATQHWVRANSILVVLMISDEDAHDPTHRPENRCENLSCIDNFYAHLSNIRLPHVSAKIYGILDGRANYSTEGHPSFNKNVLYLQWRDPHENKPLFDYHHALYNYKRQLNNLGVVLQKISTNISKALQNTFVLTNAYDEDDIIVTLFKTDGNTEALQHNAFTLTNQTLVIDPDQLIGVTKVEVRRQ